MRWFGKGSGNVEDGRGGGGGRMALGGGIGLIVAIVAMLFGQDPQQLMDMVPGIGQEQTKPASEINDKGGQFIKIVLGYTEEVWNEQFRQKGMEYREPKVRLFTGQVQSGCGSASAASGPFYCPADEKAYIDLSFYDDLQNRFGAKGDFAQAYVIAHEIGHHVQNLLGTSDKVQQARSRLGEREYNKLSVRLELQADFYAGLWAHHAQKKRNILEEGDIEEALTAANAIGDDRLQKQSQGEIVPDAFTHGTSEQRMRWFKKGYETGDMDQGDTFSVSDEEL